MLLGRAQTPLRFLFSHLSLKVNRLRAIIPSGEKVAPLSQGLFIDLFTCPLKTYYALGLEIQNEKHIVTLYSGSSQYIEKADIETGQLQLCMVMAK